MVNRMRQPGAEGFLLTPSFLRPLGARRSSPCGLFLFKEVAHCFTYTIGMNGKPTGATGGNHRGSKSTVVL